MPMSRTPTNQPRVVITGAGAVTNIGHDAVTTWDAMVQGRSGITRVLDLPDRQDRRPHPQLG